MFPARADGAVHCLSGAKSLRVKEVAGENCPFESVSQTLGSSEDALELIEMANLPTDRTGVEGVICISAAQARHAPRVKWYPGRPNDKMPCLSVTIEPLPQAFNHHLPARVFEAASMPVKAVGGIEPQGIAGFLGRRQFLDG